MSIISLLNEIKEESLVLPAIQRDFVWPENKVIRLLDSIMRGYPIGILLLWETFNDMQYRLFDRDHKEGNLYSFDENTQHKKLKLVLDGQQRLQSLYIALYGSIGGKYLYFDVLSGRENDDLAEERYYFDFERQSDMDQRNEEIVQELLNQGGKHGNEIRVKHYVKVADLFAMGPQQREELKQRLALELSLDNEDVTRLGVNLATFDNAFTKDENILKVSTIDENLPSESPYRKSEGDVLEVFVRVNTLGTPLSRSDLIFSMLKLNWKESAEALPEFVANINKGNSFDLNNDFVIRCLFAVSDLGTKFQLDLLRKKGNVEKLKENFGMCCDAIRAAVDFVFNNCWCASSRVVGGQENIIPVVYYVFHTKNHEVPNSQIDNLRKALFVFGFTRPFSRYADSRLAKFIRDELRPLAEDNDETFPLESAIWWVGYWERIREYGPDLLQANPLLTLHLVQGLAGGTPQYVRNMPQIDHIFPRSILRKKGKDEALINHYANFWILTKGKNQNKSNKHPTDYFEDVGKTDMKNAILDPAYFDYRRYTTFIEDRSDRILKRITEKTGLSEEDFPKDV